MDINNNQQINTFTKGMDTDTSDMYMGEGSYRYAENLRVVTDEDSNSGELHIIEGTNKLFSIALSKNELLLGYTSIRNYVITIIKNNENKWAIYRYNADNNFRKLNNELNKELVAGWFTETIWPSGWNGKTKPLSLVTRWEADDNVKLYIANGETELLSINVAKTEQGSNFETVFATTKIVPTPIKAKVSNRYGAALQGTVFQYGYVTYKVNGSASSLSTLSNVVTEPVDKVTGFKTDELSTKIIELTIPEEVVGKYIRIYRIAYLKSGQLPKVDVIYDRKCYSGKIDDVGQSIENISSAEFIATNKLLFVPKEIESKGDYLFAGNVRYSQDDIDEKFKDFDARSYSDGNYYYDTEGVKHYIKENYSQIPHLDDDVELLHDQFDNQNNDFDPGYWKATNGVNGHGLCFDWKYSYINNSGDRLYFMQQYAGAYSNQTPRTYGRNEVYRFGVRLFDIDGNASSIKWIADIKMPNYYNYPKLGDTTIKDYIYASTGEREKNLYVTVNNLSITFIPVNTNSDRWKNVYKYEIVQAKRTIDDSFKITQGICGYPMRVHDLELCLPYFLTTDRFKVRRAMSCIMYYATETSHRYVTIPDWDVVHDHNQDTNCLVYACPEYTYQPDDIKAILSTYKTTIWHKFISCWTRDAGMVRASDDSGFNAQDSDSNASLLNTQMYLLQYFNPLGDISGGLLTEGADMHILIGGTVSKPTYKEFLLSSQVAAHDLERAQFTPLGGNTVGGRAWKKAYFTNMFPLNLKYTHLDMTNSNMNPKISINDIDFIDAQDPAKFADGEWPTYKNQFKILQNDEKFFNWTNPVMMSPGVYDRFTSGGSNTKESWYDLALTSYESDYILKKYHWNQTAPGGDYEDLERNIVIGSYGLSMPISPGGPNIVLLFSSDQKYNFYYDTASIDISNGRATMPCINISNIVKTANPYGGYNINAINRTNYISGGYVSKKNNQITVSMGDNYITMFVYCLYHNFDNSVCNSVTSGALQYIVPIESTVDLTKQCSNYLQATHNNTLPVAKPAGETTFGRGVWVQVKPTTLGGRFTQTTDMYMYNTAYSVLPDVITYAAENVINKADSLYDSRIHYSMKKQNNEIIDNWTTFKAIDYLDVDSRYGQITGLKLFKDKLIFLQENGAGVLSVSDRIILKDQESANIIVGNGGVLDRYDYFTTIYGMKPDQHVVDASNDALYWWDGYRKEIIAYTDGYNVNLLLRIKNVANYINKGTESATPSIVYDANNKEVLFNVVNDECITYNEQIQQFTSVYTFNPIYYSNIDGKIYLTDQWVDREHLYEYNQYNEHDADGPKLFEEEHHPMLKYVVNKEPTFNKVFDIQTFGGRFYGGSDIQTVDNLDKHIFKGEHNNDPLHVLTFEYNTPTKQKSIVRGDQITNREYDYRLAVPRNNDNTPEYLRYGGRMRGKTMECVLTSSSNDKDFSIQYITTKYRMSWS